MTAHKEQPSSGIEFGHFPDTVEFGIQEIFDLFDVDQLQLGLEEISEQSPLIPRSHMIPPRMPYVGHHIPGRTR